MKAITSILKITIGILLLCLLTSTSISAQIDSTHTYPYKYIEDGKVIGVLFTVEQAQKIDNDYELFTLMDSVIKEYGLTDKVTIGVMDALNNKIVVLELTIDNLNKMLLEKDSIISNRNEVIEAMKKKIDLSEKEIDTYKEKELSHESEKKELKKEIRKQKIQKVVGFVASGIVTVGIVILTLF